MTVDSTTLREWLSARRTTNELCLAMMALRYDLDGATEAGQLGLAWRAQEDLLRFGVQLHLCQAGVALPVRHDEDRLDRGFRVLDALERTDPVRGAVAWRLWLRPIPPAAQLADETHRTLTFLAERLGQTWVRSRWDAVRKWASDTDLLRTAAKAFGVAQSDDWYLSAATSGTSNGDWYSEVLASIEAEEKEGRA